MTNNRPIICGDAGNTLLAPCSQSAGPIGGNLEKKKTKKHIVLMAHRGDAQCQMASPPLALQRRESGPEPELMEE